ncbi:MAG TPA: hypothetical protein VF648_18945 [Pyrinomonadaceae bacterium]
MSDEELDQLAEDIAMFGQREPILLFENRIVDGRNRYLACEQRGITPIVVEYAGQESELVQLAISLNLRRRHLDESQRAMVAAKLANMRRGSQETNAPIGALVSQTDAAEMLNVSRRSVQRAATVVENGVMELVEKVDIGEISVSEAARIAEMPRGKQIRLLKRGREDQKKLSKKLIENKAVEINKETKAVCLCCNSELEFSEENLLVHLTKLIERAPARLERYLLDPLDELQEEIGNGVATQNRNARILIENAIRDGFRTREQIKKHTELDFLILNAAIAVMIEYKLIIPKTQEGKTETARGQRKEFFMMSDEVVGACPDNEQLQEKIIKTVAATQQQACLLIEKAIRGGFQTREDIKMHSALDTNVLSPALASMVKSKAVSSKVEFSRGNRKEYFTMSDQASREDAQEAKFEQFIEESVTENQYLH